MTLVADVKARIEAEVTDLAGRVEEVADLAVLVQKGGLPNRSPVAFVVDLGFDGGAADAAVNAFRQRVDNAIGVILYVEAAGDLKRRRALPTIDALKDALLDAVCGWAPADAIGDFTVRRGRLLSVAAGGVLYQIDFAIQDQLRVMS